MSSNCQSLESTYIPSQIRRRVLSRDSFKCVWCGEPETHRVSHFIQKQAGGPTSEFNLVVTCEKCNRKRHYDSPPEFISKLRVEFFDPTKEFRTMRIKIFFPDPNRNPIEGEVDSLPQPTANAFYLRHIGNGCRELIFVEPGLRIVELGALMK